MPDTEKPSLVGIPKYNLKAASGMLHHKKLDKGKQKEDASLTRSINALFGPGESKVIPPERRDVKPTTDVKGLRTVQTKVKKMSEKIHQKRGFEQQRMEGFGADTSRSSTAATKTAEPSEEQIPEASSSSGEGNY